MNILEDGPLRRILRERGVLISPQERPEEIILRWREKRVPQPTIEMAMKMADRWIKGVIE